MILSSRLIVPITEHGGSEKVEYSHIGNLSFGFKEQS
jgi:hypothetical protein